eukprot:13968414-Alexandrium_andersonii.AAC.1
MSRLALRSMSGVYSVMAPFAQGLRQLRRPPESPAAVFCRIVPQHGISVPPERFPLGRRGCSHESFVSSRT